MAELRKDRRTKLQQQNPKAEAYVDFKDLVRDKKVDAVTVFTGVPEHARMAEYAMKRGKHVVCAVPAAITLEECERLIDTVKSTGMTYMNAETSYYYPAVMTCRKWRAEGKFGEIFYSEGEYNHDIEDLRSEPKWFSYEGKPTWRLGLPPMFYITHSSAGVISVTGERLTEVACLGWATSMPLSRRTGTATTLLQLRRLVQDVRRPCRAHHRIPPLCACRNGAKRVLWHQDELLRQAGERSGYGQ